MGVDKELRIGTSAKIQFDGGICYDDESSIELSQSPYGGLLNMCLDDGGMPIKRQGQQFVYETSLGSEGIKGLFADYKGETILVHGQKLYKQEGAGQPVELYSELSTNEVFMFSYNAILYILDGVKYLQYDGKEVKEVEPYVPRVTMNRKPDGSNSVIDESWNMIGRGFKDSFNGDGASKVYRLSMNNLDVDNLICEVNGNITSEFTVNKSTGEVTFNVAPSAGTNNVVITAYKTFEKLRENILNCKVGIEFSNRMFLAGNRELANYYFASGLNDNADASYFPQKYQYSIKGSDKAVTGFKVHYNKLVVFKEELTCTVTASIGLDNEASFPIEFLNTDVGCDIPNSIQLINNNIVFANTYGGVHMIVSTDVIGEKAIVPISRNVNGTHDRPGLIYEDLTELKRACSIDFNNKYYLCVGSKCYIWDYKDNYNVNYPNKLKWFIWDNINAYRFAVRGNQLLYGHKDIGMLCRFNASTSDFGNGIKGVWKSKLIDFGYPDYLKTISYIWYTCKANAASDIKINYYNDSGDVVSSAVIPASELSSFEWGRFGWDSFSWSVQKFAPTLRLKAKIKKVRYFQIELTNDKVNENLSIINLVIKYNLTKKVK